MREWGIWMHGLFLAAMKQETWEWGDYLATLPCEHSTELPWNSSLQLLHTQCLSSRPGHAMGTLQHPQVLRGGALRAGSRRELPAPRACPVPSHPTQPQRAHPPPRAVTAELLGRALGTGKLCFNNRHQPGALGSHSSWAPALWMRNDQRMSTDSPKTMGAAFTHIKRINSCN